MDGLSPAALAPIRQIFNAHLDAVRVVTLVSPT